jgi:hypothetical protein
MYLAYWNPKSILDKEILPGIEKNKLFGRTRYGMAW